MTTPPTTRLGIDTDANAIELADNAEVLTKSAVAVACATDTAVNCMLLLIVAAETALATTLDVNIDGIDMEALDIVNDWAAAVMDLLNESWPFDIVCEMSAADTITDLFRSAVDTARAVAEPINLPLVESVAVAIDVLITEEASVCLTDKLAPMTACVCIVARNGILLETSADEAASATPELISRFDVTSAPTEVADIPADPAKNLPPSILVNTLAVTAGATANDA